MQILDMHKTQSMEEKIIFDKTLDRSRHFSKCAELQALVKGHFAILDPREPTAIKAGFH